MVIHALPLVLAVMAAVPRAPLSSDIEAAGPQGALKGTLTGPTDGHRPVVLILLGSGPTDRDGNNTLGVKAAPYRLLAEGLAQDGIASVRIDKRGAFANAGAADGNAVTISDYVHDTIAWIAAIRQRTGAHCVWLLGHSEGGLVALATAAQRPAGVCGLLLVSTPGRPLGDVMKQQLRANPANAPLLEQALPAIDALAAGQRVDISAFPAPLGRLLAPAVQGFLISAFALDPAKLAASAAGPVLILQGERDLQVDVADAERLKSARPDATLARLPNVNHVLKTVVTSERGANFATYADPALPIAPSVVDAIAQFVTANAPHRP